MLLSLSRGPRVMVGDGWLSRTGECPVCRVWEAKDTACIPFMLRLARWPLWPESSLGSGGLSGMEVVFPQKAVKYWLGVQW